MNANRIVVCLAAISALVTSAVCWAEKPDPRFEIAGGTIINQEGKPISGATVLVTKYKATRTKKDKQGQVFVLDGKYITLATIRTDDQGKFWREHCDLGFMLAAVADGYCYAEQRGGLSFPGHIEIQLWPEYKIKGRVVDEDGKPLAGVKVTPEWCQALAKDEVRFQKAPDFMIVTTGADGSFVIPHMPDPKDFGHYRADISFKKSGRAPISRTYTNENAGEQLIVVCPRSCTLEGTVVLPPGAVNGHQKVWLTLLFDKKWGGARYPTADARGRFRVTDIPPGRHVFSITDQGYNFRPEAGSKRYMPEPKDWTLPLTTVELGSAETKRVELVGVKGALIGGTIVDASTGKPIASAMFNITHGAELDEGGQGRTVPDDNGKFCVRVAPGPVRFVLKDIDGKQVDPKTAPTLDFSVADGEEKTDIVWKLDTPPVK